MKRNMIEVVAELATIENALAYAATNEQFIFCIDALQISAHSLNSDYLVEMLEEAFQVLLDAICNEQGHTLIKTSSVANSETALEEFECTRCGRGDTIVWY